MAQEQGSEKLERLISLEWDFFEAVNNRGGRANCQDNYPTFRVMRLAQAMNWSDELVDDWTCDLESFGAEGRNPMTEKYARMEQTTYPEEYAELALSLPEVSVEVEGRAASLSRQMADWAQETSQHYPHLAQLGRPIHSDEDHLGKVSIETYDRCELMSFSAKTLRAYDELQKRCIDAGENLYEKILDTTVRLLGYQSLDAAEESAARQTAA